VQPEAKQLAAKADAVVLCVGFDPETESEGADRTFQLPVGQEQLIKEIAAANDNTPVVIISGGAVDMASWLDHVPAALEAWYPGQEGGTALAEILFGDANPSGRLPVSLERQWPDNPVHDSYYPAAGANRVAYKEGIFVGYRGYQHNNIKPLFPFGFGLSYTTFKYSNIRVTGNIVGFDLTNTGSRAGAAVAQVYIAPQNPRVPRPVRELKGLARVELRPGENRHVQIALDDRAFSYWDSDADQWRADTGPYRVELGSSCEQIELKATVRLPASLAVHKAP
jgi:beta-glucosidase